MTNRRRLLLLGSTAAIAAALSTPVVAATILTTNDLPTSGPALVEEALSFAESLPFHLVEQVAMFGLRRQTTHDLAQLRNKVRMYAAESTDVWDRVLDIVAIARLFETLPSLAGDRSKQWEWMQWPSSTTRNTPPRQAMTMSRMSLYWVAHGALGCGLSIV